MARDDLIRRLGIEHPIIQAPMAGGPTTPELVAAVSRAGALGSVGAAGLGPEQIRESARRIRALTDRPWGINLFAGGYERDRTVAPDRMLALLSEVHARLGIPPPAAPAAPPDPFPAQLEAVLEVRPAVFSFTFGIPEAEALERVRRAGILIMGTATTVRDAQALAGAGVDAVVVQGGEAGGHRGTFDGAFEAAMEPTATLVQGTVRAVALPVVAAGGIMDGRDVARMLALGASAAQLGTAFLACPESGAAPAYKRAVLEARQDTTVVTRAFSGRPARGLANGFIRSAEATGAILPFPVQNHLTRAMRAAAAAKGDPDHLSMWAGQGVARARALPAAELVRALAEEMRGA